MPASKPRKARAGNGGGGGGPGRGRDAASKRWGIIAFVSGIAGALVLWRMPSRLPDGEPLQANNSVTVRNDIESGVNQPTESTDAARVVVPSGTRVLGGLRAGLRDEAPASFDSTTHAFFLPGTVPGSEESVGVPAAWPAEESITLIYAAPTSACRGTTAGAWRLADENDARDLGGRFVTLVARRGDCPVEGTPALALRGVVPADVVFLPAGAKGLEPGSSALAKGLPREARVESVAFAFQVGRDAWAAVTARFPADPLARRVLVPIDVRHEAPIAPLTQGASPRK